MYVYLYNCRAWALCLNGSMKQSHSQCSPLQDDTHKSDTQHVQLKVQQAGRGQDSDLATGDHKRFSSGGARSR